MNSQRQYSIRQQRGIALVLTLAVLAVLALIVIGFLVSMRTEQSAARAQTSVLIARQLAQGAVDEAIFMMRTNMPALSATQFYVTQPGRAILKNFSGAPTFDDLLFSVYTPLSWAGTNNLNSDQSIISSNSLYSTVAARAISVDWINVCTNGAATNTPSTIPLLGRYAYWVDDEATKLNINSAFVRSTTNGITSQDVDLTVLPGVGSAIATNTRNYAVTTGFYTAEQWKMVSSVGSAIYNRNQAYITAYSRDDGLTPWGTPKFDLNSSQAAFQSEIDGGTGCLNTLNSPSLNNFFGQNFTGKFNGELNITKQLMANISDFPRPFTGVITNTGAQVGHLASGFGTNGIPLYYLGLRAHPHLNEITAQVGWWYPNPGNPPLRGKVWINCELVNPYSTNWVGGSVKVMIDRFRYTVTSTNTPPTFADYDDGNPGNWNLEQEVVLPIVPAHSYTNVTVGFDFDAVAAINTNTLLFDDSGVITQAVVKLRQVRLLQTAGNDNTICDWAWGRDLGEGPTMMTNTFTGVSSTITDAQFYFPKTNALGAVTTRLAAGGGNPPNWSPLFTCGIAKNDPRIRTFVAWRPPAQAWYRVGFPDGFSVQPATTVGSENTGIVDFTSGTGIASIPNDSPPSAVFPVTTHPSFYTRNLGPPTNYYESVGELGYVHTGLPWRTLMLQPRPSSESTANLIPDWAVLDIFTATNATKVGLVNLNCGITSLGTTSPRTNQLQAVLTGIAASDQGPLVANIYSRAWANTDPVSGWANKRTNTFNFLPDAYNLIGELCEVNVMATNWSSTAGYTNDFTRESRVRSVVNLVTTRSNAFTIWALGQAIQDVNNNGAFDPGTDTIVAESKIQAVVERYVESGQVKFRTLYFRYYAE